MALIKKKTEDSEDFEEINIVKEIFSLLIYIVVVIVLIYLILHYVGQRTKVNGDSMNNTLYNEDNLWIDKLSYRFNAPERFDIVVFPFEGSDVYYIKRIIGLPGETVYIDEDGIIYINDEPLEENYGREVIRSDNRGRAAEPIILGDDEYFVLGDNRNNSQDSRREEVGNIHIDDIEGKAVFRLWPFSRFGTIKK